MTREEVEQGIVDLGYSTNRDKVQNGASVTILFDDEIVGLLGQEALQLADYIPSVVGKEWRTITRRTFMYDWMENMDGVKAALEELKDSAVRYDSYQRETRKLNVKLYFKEQELKKLRRNELISSLERGEHLSREELRELSAMGYTL